MGIGVKLSRNLWDFSLRFSFRDFQIVFFLNLRFDLAIRVVVLMPPAERSERQNVKNQTDWFIFATRIILII